jgi:hypothetical protein
MVEKEERENPKENQRERRKNPKEKCEKLTVNKLLM